MRASSVIFKANRRAALADCYCTVSVNCCVCDTPFEVPVTVMVEVPAGVPVGCGGVEPLEAPPPPHPESKAPERSSRAKGSNATNFGWSCGQGRTPACCVKTFLAREAKSRSSASSESSASQTAGGLV